MRLIFLLLAICFCSSVHAATINAATGSAADVQTALNSASAGDTVVIPSGTHTWTSAVSLTAPANLTILGAGSLSTQGGGDVTTIVDGYNSAGAFLTIDANATGTLRIAGLTFISDNTLSTLKSNAMIRIFGGPVRVDHCHFDCTQGTCKPVWFYNPVGLMDHCIVDSYQNNAIYFSNGAGTSGKGNEVWAAATGFGTNDFFFMEDNLWRAVGTTGPIRIADGWSGLKVVWRFNTIQGGSGMEVHATGHAGDDRGARATEGYGNSFILLPGQTVPPYDMADCSSGCALVWGNSSESNSLKNGVVFNVTRKNNNPYGQAATPTGWGYAGTNFNGTGSNWDGNVDTATGYPCIDQPARGQGDLLIGSFPSKVNDTTGTIAWPNQALEPIYIWANVITPASGWGGSMYSNAAGDAVVADRDYYAQASGIQTTSSSPFDGTSGTGWGTLANRPTTCTAGVAYWATDQGSWNASATNPYGVQQSGADGVLYKATSTNTWTLYYTPYTYPHPLQAASSSTTTISGSSTTTISGSGTTTIQ